MHEMSLVRKVVDIVAAECGSDDAAEVLAVHLTIGEATDVIENYVEELFQFLARGTNAQNAKLVIARTPLTVRCDRCGTVFPIDVRNSETWGCPQCGAYQKYRLFSGREFRVDRIDVARLARGGEACSGMDEGRMAV